MSCTIYSIMYVLLTLGTCALGTIAKTLVIATTSLAQHTGELSTDEASDRGFISTLKICMFSCHAMTLCILVVPFDSLAYLSLCACMQCLDPSEQLAAIIVDIQYCSV